MKKYYFTFGMNHEGPKGTEREGKSLFRYYVTIESEDEMTARGLMFARYKDKWSFCYSEDQFEKSISQFGLIEYEIIVQDKSSKTA